MRLAMLIILISILLQNKTVSVQHFSMFPRKTNLFYHLVHLPSSSNRQDIEMLKSIKDKVAVNSEQFTGYFYGKINGSKRRRALRHQLTENHRSLFLLLKEQLFFSCQILENTLVFYWSSMINNKNININNKNIFQLFSKTETNGSENPHTQKCKQNWNPTTGFTCFCCKGYNAVLRNNNRYVDWELISEKTYFIRIE